MLVVYLKLLFQIMFVIRENINHSVCKERPRRSTFSEVDKKMFINIIRTGKVGKFLGQIVENK